MSKSFEFKTLEYLDLDIKFPDYNLCRRTTLDNSKLVCRIRDNFSHRLHSNSNQENFEQLNTITDLLFTLSEKLKTNLEKQNKPLVNTTLSENIIYLKNLLEDIFQKTKDENNALIEKIKNLEKEIITNTKLLETILYGKQRT